jgi:hypothetical protein
MTQLASINMYDLHKPLLSVLVQINGNLQVRGKKEK